LARAPGELHRLDFVSLQALLALHNLEGDLLAFLQGLEAGALDRAEVDEDVRAAFRGDEAEALGVVEPLDGTSLTIRLVLLLLEQFEMVTRSAGIFVKAGRDCRARGNAHDVADHMDLPHRVTMYRDPA
jgi:hypothetical protein